MLIDVEFMLVAPVLDIPVELDDWVVDIPMFEEADPEVTGLDGLVVPEPMAVLDWALVIEPAEGVVDADPPEDGDIVAVDAEATVVPVIWVVEAIPPPVVEDWLFEAVCVVAALPVVLVPEVGVLLAEVLAEDVGAVVVWPDINTDWRSIPNRRRSRMLL